MRLLAKRHGFGLSYLLRDKITYKGDPIIHIVQDDDDVTKEIVHNSKFHDLVIVRFFRRPRSGEALAVIIHAKQQTACSVI